jgi:hypothetical protein
MKPSNELRHAVADLCERLADNLDGIATTAASLRRLARLIRPPNEGGPTKPKRNGRVPQPDSEPSDIDRIRARKVLEHKGIHVS